MKSHVSAGALPVPGPRTMVWAGAALVCFALNSLLCRAALGPGFIDASSFTLVRLASGALVLLIVARIAPPPPDLDRRRSIGDLLGSATALFLYALPFSLAYLRLSAGTGAFVVFGCVQLTMIGFDLRAGRRLRAREGFGLVLSLFGLAWLTRPGAASPDPAGVALMALAGFSWGVYSIRGRRSGPALQATAGNFVAALPMALVGSALGLSRVHLSAEGILLAIVSGGLTSGLGYVAWYAVLPSLGVTRASIVQLAVPPLASVLGVALLGETLTWRLLVSAPLILGGIAVTNSNPRVRERA